MSLCFNQHIARSIETSHPAENRIRKKRGAALPSSFLSCFPARLYSTSMILIWLAVKPATSVTMSTMRAVSASVMPPSGAATARLGQGRSFRPHAGLAQPPLLQLLRRCRGRRRGRKAGDEAGAPPEGRRGGLRCGAVRPVRGLRRQAGTVKISSCPPRPKRVYYKELFIV